MQKPRWIALRQDLIALIQRLQDQVGRAGGTEQRQCIPHRFFVLNRRIPAQMQICSACDHRQSLVAGIAAHGRTQCNGVLTALRQKPQVSTVSIIHQKRNIKRFAGFCQRRHILHASQIIRAGDVDAERPAARSF